MNIAVNTRLLLPNRMEGIGRYIYETTRRIVKLNPQHQFFFLFDRAYDSKYIFAENVTPLVIGPPTRHPLIWHYWFEYRLPKVFKKHKIDAFLSGDNYLSLSTDVPTIMVSHDLAYHHYPEHLPYWTQRFYNKNAHKYHKHAKRIIAVSNATKDDIIRTYGIAAEKIDVAYNSAPEGFIPMSAEAKKVQLQAYTSGHPYFVYIGAIHPRKNIVNLLKAFELFKQSGQSKHQLILVGRKAWKNNALDSLYNSMEFKSEVHFLDHVEDVRPVLGAASALVYVSSFEGFGIPILEGFHSGVPVITSNVSSMPEVAGDAAILVDPFDPKSIAVAMKDLAEDPAAAESLIRLGDKRKQLFSWDKSAKIISDELNNLTC